MKEPRNLSSVLGEVLALIPVQPDTERLIALLTRKRDDLAYTAPEDMSCRWLECSRLLAAFMRGNAEWQKSVLSVWTDAPKR